MKLRKIGDKGQAGAFFLIVGAIFVAFLLIGGSFAIYQKYRGGGGDGNLLSLTGKVKSTSLGSCDPSATDGPELRYQMRNPLNTSGNEYKATTTYVYDITDLSKPIVLGDDNYVGSLATLATGFQSRNSGIDCQCFHKYRIVSPASDGSLGSTSWDMECNGNDNTATAIVTEQSPLVFKVYDNDNSGWVYGASEETDSAGGIQASATSFYSKTGNSTGDENDISNSGYDYTISISINTSDSGKEDTTFTDQGLIIGINDEDNKAHWGEFSTLELGGVDLTAKKVDCLAKMASDGNDWCFDAGDKTLGKAVTKLHMVQAGSGNNNPGGDNLTVSFYPSGYFRSIKNAGAKIGYTTDADSPSYVFTASNLILRFQ